MRTSLDVNGFGEFDPPQIDWAYAISPTRVVVKWNEALDAASAMQASNYVLNGPVVQSVYFSGADEVKAAAFNASWAPTRSDVVVLES